MTLYYDTLLGPQPVKPLRVLENGKVEFKVTGGLKGLWGNIAHSPFKPGTVASGPHYRIIVITRVSKVGIAYCRTAVNGRDYKVKDESIEARERKPRP